MEESRLVRRLSTGREETLNLAQVTAKTRAKPGSALIRPPDEKGSEEELGRCTEQEGEWFCHKG